MRTITSLATVLALTLLASVALAGPPTQPLPTEKGHHKDLQIRFVKYTGGASGRMVVEVHNRGASPAVFDPKGLYFVPQGDPESAPQRLGAAGPFEGPSGQARETLRIPAGKRVTLQLQVFCLDSHRSSPRASQKFHISKKLLPKTLRKSIQFEADAEIRGAKGDLKRAVPKIQGKVWKTRNKKWIKLEGERRNEKAPEGNRHPQRRHPNERFEQRLIR